jgi:hypothetical protein
LVRRLRLFGALVPRKPVSILNRFTVHSQTFQAFSTPDIDPHRKSSHQKTTAMVEIEEDLRELKNSSLQSNKQNIDSKANG